MEAGQSKVVVVQRLLQRLIWLVDQSSSIMMRQVRTLG